MPRNEVPEFGHDGFDLNLVQIEGRAPDCDLETNQRLINGVFQLIEEPNVVLPGDPVADARQVDEEGIGMGGSQARRFGELPCANVVRGPFAKFRFTSPALPLLRMGLCAFVAKPASDQSPQTSFTGLGIKNTFRDRAVFRRAGLYHCARTSFDSKSSFCEIKS